MQEIEKGDWIEVTIGDHVSVCRVLGFSEKGIDIFDEWDKWLVEWRDIDSIKKYIPANIDTEEKG